MGNHLSSIEKEEIKGYLFISTDSSNGLFRVLD